MPHKIWNGGDSTNPNSFTEPDNWAPTGVPVNNDVVTIAPEAESLLDNVNQASLKLSGFHVAEGFKGDIGSPGNPLKFKLNADDFSYAGTGIAYLDLTVDTIADISPVIDACGVGRTGIPGLSLTGDKFKTLTFQGTGSVGIGLVPGDTSSRLDTLDVSGGGTVEVGASIQKMSAGATDVTVSHPSASVTVDCDTGTVEAVSGAFRQRRGEWSTANIHAASAYASGSGTYATTNVDAAGKVYNNENNTVRTFTDIEMENGGSWLDPAGTGAYTNPIEFPTGMDRCTLDFGRERRLDVDDIP